MDKLSIVLVDDHKLFREGLKSLMENFEYVDQIQEASNGHEFLQLLEAGKPDIVFMDIEMPEMDGITATRKALEINQQLNVVALSMYGNENYYTQMISAGAKGFILKNSGIQDVENAIQNVMSGNNYFSHEIFQRLIHGLGRKQQKSTNPELSSREEEIVFLICKGLSNQEIADKLYLSKRTVDKHRENILSKTQSKNTAGIVMYAVKNGIVEV